MTGDPETRDGEFGLNREPSKIIEGWGGRPQELGSFRKAKLQS